MKTLESKRKASDLLAKKSTKASDKNKRAKQRDSASVQYQGWLDVKRQRRNWDQTHRLLFKSIGFVTSLLLVNIMFSWKTAINAPILMLSETNPSVNELIDIPISKQPPPPPKKTIDLFVIKEVDEEILEETEINLDVEVTAETEITEIVFEAALEEEETDEIFTIVETPPSPVGGMSAFNKYLASNLEYPGRALRMGISGRVFLKFTIEKDGSITDINVAKGIGAGCDEEAIRVLENAPPWSPGRQRGQAVRVRMIVPIRFILSEG